MKPIEKRLPVLLFSLAFGVVTAGSTFVAPASAATEFSDETCPNVDDAGRKLNAIIDSSRLLTDDLIAAAAAMVDGYRVCMRGYDDNTYNQAEAAGQQHTNATSVGRIYARLGLARALQRVGDYAADQKKYGDAKIAYDEALKRIDEMSTIPSLDIGGGLGDTPEHRLIAKGADLRKAIETSEAALPK
jgi:hypothetical protein